MCGGGRAVAKTYQTINHHNGCALLISQDGPLMEPHIFVVTPSVSRESAV